MKRFVIILAAAALGASALPAKTYYSIHAGTEGVGVHVGNYPAILPVMAPPPPPSVRVPFVPGYVPAPVNRKAAKKAVKHYRKAAKHYRKATEAWGDMFMFPGAYYDYDDDDYEDYYKHHRKHHKKHHKKHHRKHHHDDDD